MSNLVCWKDLILQEMENQEDKFISWTLSDEEAAATFNAGYGRSNGCCFTAWGEKRVYFPAVYDGQEWVDSAPRNPCDEKMGHVGSE